MFPFPSNLSLPLPLPYRALAYQTKTLEQACTTQKARRSKLTNINLSRAAKSTSFCCSLKKILERQLHPNIFEVGLLQHFLQLRKLLRAACGP